MKSTCQKIHTAEELATIAKREKPHVRYAYGQKHGGGCVAAWSNNRWVPVAGQLIGSGEWYSLTAEILVNGKPIDTGTEWTEVLA